MQIKTPCFDPGNSGGSTSSTGVAPTPETSSPPAGVPNTSPTGSAPSDGVVGASPVSPAQSAQLAPPVQLEASAALSTLHQLLAPVPDAELKDNSVESIRAHQIEQHKRQGWRAFQNEMREVVSKPVQIAEGITHVFTSQQEVESYGRFVQDLANGRVQLSPRDLLILHNSKKFISQAQEYGARQYEAGLRRPAAQQQTQGRTVVLPPAKPERSDSKVPSITEILKQKNPQYLADFMAGKIQLV